MPPRAPHILCFAPYTDWSLHSAREVTILQALRQRGCSVTYITCDGAFSDCDLLQASTGAPAQKPAHACLFCQARVATRLAGWGMPFRWLGQWLNTEDRTKAARWVQSLQPADYFTAQYGDWAVGAWVRSSVHRHFRHNVLDLSDAATVGVYGSYLYSGLLACFGLDRIFEEEKPDAQLLFNGRMAPTRVALEMARIRGVRTICEERGYVTGYMQLYDNVSCVDWSDLAAMWDEWKDVPLTIEEVGEAADALEDRWLGRSSELTVFSGRIQSARTLAVSLGLDPGKPLWALFTSSLDETADRDRGDEVFKDQYEWIDATVNYLARRTDLQLAVRVHPNVASRKSLGRNLQDVAYFQDLSGRLPPNVRLIASDDPTSSYDLAVAAAAGLVWFSTIGVEMAAMGRPVVRVGAGPLQGVDFLKAPPFRENYDGLLDELARSSLKSADISATVQAWRFVHLFFLRRSQAFPLVRQPNWYAGEMAYSSPDALGPGKNAVLDRICAAFMNGAPLHDPAPERPPEAAQAEARVILQRAAPYRQGRA